MNKQINCNNCENPIGQLKDAKITIDFKRVNNIEYDFKDNTSSIKCRKCSHYSILSYEDKLSNKLDLKRTAGSYL